MFLIYLIAVMMIISIIGICLPKNDRIWRWWVIGQLIRSDDRRHATAPRLKHLKYMR